MKKEFTTARKFKIEISEENLEELFEEAKKELEHMPYMPKDFNDYTEDDWVYLAKDSDDPYNFVDDCIFYHEKFCHCDKWVNIPRDDCELPEEVEEVFWNFLANELKKRFLN